MAIFDRVRGWLGPRDSVKPMTEQGTGGFAVYGGYIVKPEQNVDLLGQNRYRTASDLMANISIIAASLRYNLNLISRPSWKFDPPSDKPEAKAVAEFFDEVFSDIDNGWTRIVRRSGMYRYHGFGAAEWITKKRDDGKIGFKSIESRPQHTIEKWDLDGAGDILGIMQRDPQDGHERYLPRGKLFYLVDDTLTDSPDGMGWFRHLVDPARRLKSFLQIEGFGFERDLAGIPMGRAPIQEMNDLVASGKMTTEDKTQAINGIMDFVALRRKESGTGLVLDSKTYESKTEQGKTVSGNPLWDLQLIEGTQNSIEELGKAIERIEFEMALIMGTEGMLVGRGGEGSRALSEDKSRNMYLTGNATLVDMAESVDKDLVAVIGRMNGIPEELWPKAKPEDIAFKDAEAIAKTLADMAQAGAILAPDDPAINDLRNLLGISDAVPMDVGMINALQGKPDPTKPAPEAVQSDQLSRDQMDNSNEQAQIARDHAAQQAKEQAALDAKKPAPKPVKKAEPRTLYVQRRLLNTKPFIAWAKKAGFETTVPAEELHVTVCYSRRPLDWMAVSENWSGDRDGRLRVAPGGARLLEQFNGGAVVLLFKEEALEWRHEQFLTAGASHDHGQYQPHVTITFDAPAGLDISAIEPYQGELVFGHEIFEELNLDWKDGIVEKFDPTIERGTGYSRSFSEGMAAVKAFNPSQPRDPGGEGGGEWISAGGGEGDGKPKPKTALERIAADERVQSVDDGRSYGDPIFVNLKPGYSWSDQGSFSADNTKDALRRLKEVYETEKRFNPDQRRDPKGSSTGGRWTGGPAAGAPTEPTDAEDKGEVRPMTPETKRQLTEANRHKNLDQLLADARENQAELGKIGRQMEKDLGLKFIDPGPKSAKRVVEKVAHEGYDGAHQITDISRATFVVDSPADADKVMKALARDSIVHDKGWKRLGESGYIDRKVFVEFDNGGLAEVQLVPRGIQQIKSGKGHALYEMARKPGQAPEVIENALAESRQLYSSSIAGTPFAQMGD